MLGSDDHKSRAEFVSALRAAADFFEANPQVPTPNYVAATVYADNLYQVRKATHLTGSWGKTYSGNAYVNYSKKFGSTENGFQLDISLARDTVCKRVQVGTKHVESVEAHDEPVFEWKCDEPVTTVTEADSSPSPMPTGLPTE
jgi:hypothetical protein